MKFDIIGALDIAQKELTPHECEIKAHKDGDIFLIQIKVFIENVYEPNTAYGQQITLTKGETLDDDWWMMNNRFASAIASLKRQIEE